MNIETKIAELDAQIEDRTKTADILYADMEHKERIYKESRHVWAEVYEHIQDLKKKRELLIEFKKDCECVISRGVPVPEKAEWPDIIGGGQMAKDEDIGRTVQFNGASLRVPTSPSDDSIVQQLSRVPIFNDEREFIEPK